MEITTIGRYRGLIIDEGKQAKQFRNVSLGAESVPLLGNCSCSFQPQLLYPGKAGAQVIFPSLPLSFEDDSSTDSRLDCVVM